jgi:HD-like signal output (HDOD) protein
LSQLLAGIQLPALPQSAIRLMQLSQDQKNGPAEFAVVIEADPGLTGQVLKFVNSSYFGFPREISSVKLAITLVGIRTIKNFTLWSAVFSLIPNPKCGELDLTGLWQDSLRRALFARAFGKLLGLQDTEELFAAALLQDMALPLLAKELPQHYSRLFVARQDGRRLSQLEFEEFGWTHAEAAGLMARSWNLPESFAHLLETHHQPLEVAEKENLRPAQLAISLSSHLPATCDPQWYEKDLFVQVYEPLVGSRRPLADFFAELDDEFAQFAPILKLTTPVHPLTASLTEVVPVSVGN